VMCRIQTTSQTTSGPLDVSNRPSQTTTDPKITDISLAISP
jgi:hypothetical protein